MNGRIAGLIRSALLAGAITLARGLPAAAQPVGRAQPLIDVQQRMPEWVAQGETFPLEILIANSGTGTAEGVAVSSTLPAFLDLVEANPAPERVRGALQWNLGPLEPGRQHVLRLRVTLRSGVPAAEVRSSVRVTFQTSVTSTCAAAVKRPELALAVTGPDSGALGEPASLLITVQNRGATPAHDVTLQTLLPAGLSHPGGNDLENDLGTLEAGESRQVPLAVTPTQAGDLRQRVRVSAAGAEPVEQEVRLVVHDVKLGLTANGPRLLYEGWPGSFELVLRNQGTEVVPQVGLVAALPEGLAFVRASDNAVYTSDTHSLCWNLGELRPGEARTVVWNGVARTTGEQVCKVTLAAGPRVYQRLNVQTTVMRAAPPPAPLVPASAPAPGPAAPPPTTAPAATPVLIPPPAPSGGPPPDPAARAGPLSWRPARHPPPPPPNLANGPTPAP